MRASRPQPPTTTVQCCKRSPTSRTPTDCAPRSISAASLQAALTGARRNEQASIALYEAGRKTLQDVLDARLAALQEQDDLVQNEMGRASATVQLYRALGGD